MMVLRVSNRIRRPNTFVRGLSGCNRYARVPALSWCRYVVMREIIM
jgi:hypothetical protein